MILQFRLELNYEFIIQEIEIEDTIISLQI